MKRIAITIGDPGGIGPEVSIKSLSSMVPGDFIPVLIGDLCVIEEALEMVTIPLRIKLIDDVGEAAQLSPGTLGCFDMKYLTSFKKAVADGENGAASVRYIKKAVDLAKDKKVDAIVTAPISKMALKLGGFQWPGHTEMLAEFTGTEEYAMMLVGGPLRVILVTIHTALRNVPDLITYERVLKTIHLAQKACTMLGLERPAIAVAGLNPHGGESGVLGEEEEEVIIPAVREARAEGLNVLGPYPPDVVFYKAYRGEADIVVCMYHDQGLIPLKMIAFDTGVNVTVGIPIIRTSPDHGTAYDIAWKGIADPSSMREAIEMATKLRL
jgi:4-hydroxythreonine-4-phosphate dehydrogenase